MLAYASSTLSQTEIDMENHGKPPDQFPEFPDPSRFFRAVG